MNKEWQQSPRAWGLGGTIGALQMVTPVTLELTVSFFTLCQNNGHLPGALLLFEVNKTEELEAKVRKTSHPPYPSLYLNFQIPAIRHFIFIIEEINPQLTIFPLVYYAHEYFLPLAPMLRI